MMIAHILSCLWIFLAESLQHRNIQTWLKSSEVNVTPWHEIYINSYYFTVVTMVTVGYGDVIPISYEEKTVSILFMLFLCGIFGYSMNTVGSIIQSLNEDHAQIRQNMSIINQFMNRTKVSKKTQNAIREYLEYYWSEQRDKNHKQEEQIFEILPENLRQNLLMEGKGIVLKQTAIFRDNFSDAFKQKIVPLIQERHYIPQQLICEQGELDDCDIYFIEKGSVNILLDSYAYEGTPSSKQLFNIILCFIKVPKIDPKQIITLTAGQSFGEISFFTGQPRTAYVKSKEFTTLQIIKRQEFMNELQNFQKDFEQFCNIKDNISIYSDFQLIDLKCLSCQSLNHQLLQCPYVHFLPNHAKLRAQFMSSPPQERVFKNRKLKEKLKSIQLVKKNSTFINRLIEYDTEIEYYFQTYLERESGSEDESKSEHENSSTKQFIDDQNGNQFQFSQFNNIEDLQKRDSNIQSLQQATSQLSQKMIIAEVKQKNMYNDISPTKQSEEIDLFGNQIHRTPSSQVNKGKSRHASYVNKEDEDSLNLQKSRLGSSSYRIESSLGENRKQHIEENFVKPKGKQYYDDIHQGENTDQNQYIQAQIPFAVSQKCLPAYKNSQLKIQKLQDPLSLALQKYQTMLNKILQIFQDMAPNALPQQHELQSPSIKKHFSTNKIQNNVSSKNELQKKNSFNRKQEPKSNLMYKNQSSISNSKAIVSKRSIGRYVPEQDSKQTSNINQSNQFQTKDTNFYLDETNNVQYIQSNQDIQREFYEEFDFDIMKNFEYYFPLNNFEHQMKLMRLNIEQRRKKMLRAHIENMNILKKNKSLAISFHKGKRNSLSSSQNLYTLNRQQNNNDDKEDQSKYKFKAQRESSLFLGDSQKKYDSLSLHQGKKGPQFNLNNLSFNNQIDISQINQKSNKNYKESILNQTNLEFQHIKLNQKNNDIIHNNFDDSFQDKENDIFDGSMNIQDQQINIKKIISDEVMKRVESFNSDLNESNNKEQVFSQKNSFQKQQIKNSLKGFRQYSQDDKQRGSNSKRHLELEIESQTEYSQNRRNINTNDILIGMQNKTKL
ncbi:cyclic nucleotide-binding domain protein (macronuclear) [Tetrahymena thermophila SB210]|uniref:Cyclic nucleotide-binding domain protein n=1 Tax=Tetrahymena thermophila (strain SB210) TaxID=312017 RepID=Q23K38_TETTS|nr:cyclic nucleotide-binding domain protein [Tetrahymena thermophila SB210]EAR97005.2 cyclic nucleotide-binding domain protein [Tetrahymena thermophila SB210]|eukprot:XP_001017250.2 cyclic nucleotide-binding domain protein [Tetrahymena thermophila SB210]